MRVLVTGATGFIGAHVARALLQQGEAVRLVVRRDPPADLVQGGAEVWRADLRDCSALRGCLEGVEAVVHVAGQIRGWRWADFFQGNVTITRNLILEVLRQNPPLHRFVYFSSLAAQGPRGATGPVSHYGLSKRLAEAWVQGRIPDLPWVILRPGVVYGPGDRALLPYLQWLQRRNWLPLPTTPRYLGFVFVEDLVKVVLWALRSPAALHRVLCVMHPEALSLAEFLEVAARHMGRSGLRGWPIPPVVLRGLMPWIPALYPFVRRPPLVNPDKLREAHQREWTCRDPREVWQRSDLPPTPLDEGMRRTLEAYRARGWL